MKHLTMQALMAAHWRWQSAMHEAYSAYQPLVYAATKDEDEELLRICGLTIARIVIAQLETITEMSDAGMCNRGVAGWLENIQRIFGGAIPKPQQDRIALELHMFNQANEKSCAASGLPADESLEDALMRHLRGEDDDDDDTL